MLEKVKRFLKDDRGQGTLEYVLIIGIIVVVLFGILYLARKPLLEIMNKATNAIKQWGSDSNANTAT